MISKDKTYRTRDGREVRIYATDGCIGAPVQGAIKIGNEWHLGHWTKDGIYGLYGSSQAHDYGLIEVKPRIKRTVWLAVMGDCCKCYDTEFAAQANHLMAKRAVVKVEIDCEEGEGL
jgi:hypothetical protein